MIISMANGAYRPNVRWMRDNTESAYGPGYVSSKEHLYLAWLDGCFQPSIWAFRCSSFDEAYEHASICLCPIDDEATEACFLASDDWDACMTIIESNGSTLTEDGCIRYTETLKMIEVK